MAAILFLLRWVEELVFSSPEMKLLNSISVETGILYNLTIIANFSMAQPPLTSVNA